MNRSLHPFNAHLSSESMKKRKYKTTMKCKFYLGVLCLAASAASTTAKAQNWQPVAVKTNLLYDATTTPNIGLEISTCKKQTAQIFYGLNAWTFSDGRKAKHWVLMPEYRWWMCSRMNGHFLGVHAFGGEFSAANVNLPVPGAFFAGDNLRSELRNNRYEGQFLGAGFTYGYQWILSRHWNLEAEAGIGYAHAWYNKYPCSECGFLMKTGGTNYVGLTKLGISLMYVF